MTIRNATAGDGPAIRRLLAQLGYPDMSLEDTRRNLKHHEDPDYLVLVAEIDGRVVAFISLHCFFLMHWRDKIGRVSAFCVEDGFRSKGVGRQLLHAGEEWLFGKGCAKVELTSNNRRTRAHEFYLNLGYVEDSRRFVKYQNKGGVGIRFAVEPS